MPEALLGVGAKLHLHQDPRLNPPCLGKRPVGCHRLDFGNERLQSLEHVALGSGREADLDLPAYISFPPLLARQVEAVELAALERVARHNKRGALAAHDAQF